MKDSQTGLRQLIPFLFVAVILMLFIAPSVVTAQNISVTTNASSKIRSGPGTGYVHIGSVAAGTALTATGRNDDSSWIEVDINGVTGWIAAFLLEPFSGVDALAVKEAIPDGAIVYLPRDTGSTTTTTGDTSTEQTDTDGAVTATTRGPVNVRATPNGTQVDQLPGGTTVTLLERAEVGGRTWASLDFEGRRVWLATWVVTIRGDLNSLAPAQDTSSQSTTTTSTEAPSGEALSRREAQRILRSSYNVGVDALFNIADVWLDVLRRDGSRCGIDYALVPLPNINEATRASDPDIDAAYLKTKQGIDDTNTAILLWNERCHDSIMLNLTLNDIYWSADSAVGNAIGAFTDANNQIRNLN